MNPFRPFIRFFSLIRSLFLHGLFTLLPLAATVAIVNFSYQLISRWIAPIKNLGPAWAQDMPAAEFLIAFVILLTLGTLLRLVIVKPVIYNFEKLINQIPLIRIVYSSAKILVDFFNVPNPATVKQKVVLIEFPRKGSYNIAFLLDSAANNFQKLLPKQEQKKKFYKVFMPNSPNPTSGYFFILSEDEIIDTNITFEDAIKTIVSCGINTPQDITPPGKPKDLAGDLSEIKNSESKKTDSE